MDKSELSIRIKQGMAGCGKDIGRPRKEWKSLYKLPYGAKLTRHCPQCSTLLHPYASTLLYRTVSNKKLTEHSNIRASAAERKFFCSNKCKGMWIGKSFGFGNPNHSHFRPWLKSWKDPNKDYSKLSEQHLQNLWDFHLEELDDDQRFQWLVSKGYYNLPPPT